MLTSVTNALSQTAYAQYDYYLGKVLFRWWTHYYAIGFFSLFAAP